MTEWMTLSGSGEPLNLNREYPQRKFINPAMPAMKEWVQQGNYSCFRKAYEMSARVHWEVHGKRLLHIACQVKPDALGHLLQFLDPCQLPAGIDLTQDFGTGETILHMLMKSFEIRWKDGFDHVNAVEVLCRRGAERTATGKHP